MFGFLTQSGLKPAPDQNVIHVDGIPVRLKKNARSKRMTLRQDLKKGGFVLSHPPRTSKRSLQSFIDDHQAWILKHNETQPALKQFQNEAAFYFYDDLLILQNTPDILRGVPKVVVENVLQVPGAPEHIHRKTCDFLKADFRKRVSDLARDKATQIGTVIKRIRIADQKTRWGSCSTTGTLSFSARLVFAPMFVVDYVAAHEVAHMRHMDHSPDFWGLCQRLCMDGDRMEEAKQWLKTRHDIFMQYKLSV